MDGSKPRLQLEGSATFRARDASGWLQNHPTPALVADSCPQLTSGSYSEGCFGGSPASRQDTCARSGGPGGMM